jgi:hypothetical protein
MENHDGRRKWRPRIGFPELEASLDEADFDEQPGPVSPLVPDVFVPVFRIGPGGDQHDDRRAIPCGFARLPDPFRHLPPIRRVASNDARPRLGQAVSFPRVIFFALVVHVIGANVESKVKLPVEGVEEILWRRPVVAGA